MSELVDQFAGAAADEAHPDDVWPIPDGSPGALGRPDPFPLQNGTTPRINVTIAGTTLIGLDDQPGSLDRYGPVTAFQARAISLGGDWYRMVTDPHTGVLLDLGRTRYRPTQALIDYVCARDRTCRWPGCHQPAMLSELDHEIEFRPGQPDGGTTDPRNLRCLCTRHHHLRHTPGWAITTNSDQTTTVRSPLGTTRTAPAPTANPNGPYPLAPLVPPPF
ncbi:HNH endonuclease [Nakamurella silvestris]|nr:HNH endonuclease [Nakamurella silvestris]